MTTLLPHYRNRVPEDYIVSESLEHDEIAHCYAARFPSGYNPSDGNDQTLSPVGGVANTISAATAGIPGTLDPVGAILPGSLADLIAISAASGDDLGESTGWTAGQYVTLGDGSTAHWDGAAWVAGAA